MIGTIPIELDDKYEERIMGFTMHKGHKLYLITSKRLNTNKTYLDLDNLKIDMYCPHCETNTESIEYTGLIHLVNENDEPICADGIKLDLSHVYTPLYCKDCEYTLLEKVAAPVVCKKCGEHVTWLPTNQSLGGEKVLIGNIYHTEKCPHCDRRVRNLTLTES